MHHGDPWEIAEIAGHDVHVLDFSFPPAVLEAMASHANSLVQIDHHASARQPWAEQLEKVPGGLESFRHPTLPLTVIFDLDKSGARLAWEHFSPAKPMQLSLQHIEDIDMWRFALPGTRAVLRALRLRPFDFGVWDKLVCQTPHADAPAYRGLLAEGDAIERFFQIEIDRLAQSKLVMPVRLRGEAVDPLQARRHGLPTIVDG